MPVIPSVDNPFTALTLIAAPAILTNASSVLALGTSNRFARAVDRARALSSMMEEVDLSTVKDEWSALRLRQLGRVEKRCILLLNAMSFFYLSLGAFSASALVSLLGAVVTAAGDRLLYHVSAAIAIVAGTVGVGGLVSGCTLLLQETRLAVLNLSEEAAAVRKRFAESGPTVQGVKGSSEFDDSNEDHT
jgi:hypothetical protein